MEAPPRYYDGHYSGETVLYDEERVEEADGAWEIEEEGIAGFTKTEASYV